MISNLQASKNYGWASSGSSILSEFGTLHLEFLYLSDITGDPIFKEKVFKIRETLKQMEKPKGLYFNYVHPRMGKFTQSKFFYLNRFLTFWYNPFS